MRISSKRLRSLVAGVDDHHQAAMADLRQRTGPEASAGSRRRFLAQVGVGSAAVALGPTLLPALGLSPAGAQEDEGELTDEDLARFAASVELAVVEVYQQMLDANILEGEAKSMLETFQEHHRDHAGEVASGSVEPNAGVIGFFGPQLAEATDETTTLTAALTIEEALAATYQRLLGELQDQETAGVASTILPIEGRHAVALGSALDLEPTEYLPALQAEAGFLDPAAYPPE